MEDKSKELREILFGDLAKATYLRQSDLIPNILPFSAATLWRMVKANEFPRPVKLSKRVTAWRTADVLAWFKRLHKETTTA